MFEAKRRDPLLSKEAFDASMQHISHNIELELKLDVRAFDLSVDEYNEHKTRSFSTVNALIEQSILYYSSGSPLTEVCEHIDAALQCFLHHKAAFPDESFTVWEKDSLQFVFQAIALSSLTSTDTRTTLGIVRSLFASPNFKLNSTLSLMLTRLGFIGLPNTHSMSLSSSYASLFNCFTGDGVYPSRSDKEVSLKNYLKQWYKSMSGCYWHGFHLDNNKPFFGYWAFEAALVTVLYELDDSSYRHLPFYPKDIVDHARQAGIAEALKPNNIPQHYIAFPNDESPVSAEWVSNLSNESIFLNQGEKLPTQDDDENKIFWVSV